MKYSIGKAELEMGSKYLTELRDSNDILDDVEALRRRMDEEGYLLIRGFHDRDEVLKARKEILLKIQEKGRLAPGTPLGDGIISEENKWVGLKYNELPAFLNVVNSDRALSFFDRFLGGKSMTYDYKWLRAMTNGAFTGAHYDIVYMGRGTKNVYTLWTPLGDIPLEMGPIALCLGSHHYDRLKQTYGKMDVDRDNVDEGWLTKDPIEVVDKFGFQWASTEFKAGDAILFGMFTLHGSLNNTTNRYRISSDTRYQLASEPADERWIGEKPITHVPSDQVPRKTMDEVRKQWGI